MTPASLPIRITSIMRRAFVLLAVLAIFGVPLAYAQDATTNGTTEATTGGTSTDGTTTDGTTTAGTTTDEEPPPPPPVLIADGVTIAGIPVGGMTADEAKTILRTFFARPFTFTFHRHTRDVTPYWVGASAHIGVAVTNALSAAPSESVSLPVSLDRDRLRALVRRLARAWLRRPVNSTVHLRDLRPFVTKAQRGYAVRQRETRDLVRLAVRAHERGPIRVPGRVLRPRITRSNFGPVIVVRRGSHRLYLYNSMRYWATFGVAVGMPQYPTPLGRFYIAVKQRNPWWYPPDAAWAAGASPIPPGPGNPLGTRWMGLSWGGIGIHGTPDSASIGYSASHGCIRMRIPEAEWLFERVRIGTPVFIVSA
jgi:hypothetical protein